MSDKNAPVTVQPGELVPYQGSRRTTRTSAEMDQIKVDVQGIMDELLRLSMAPMMDEGRRQQLLADLEIVKRAAAEQNWSIVVDTAHIGVDFERPENVISGSPINYGARGTVFIDQDTQEIVARRAPDDTEPQR